MSDPAYSRWYTMLDRAYDPKFKVKNPTYENVTVCDEWQYFSNFKKWFEQNYYQIGNEEMQLDKDIINKNNKVYCPEFCVFVPKSINALFTNRKLHRGNLPVGVVAKRTKFEARCSIDGTMKYLGICNTREEAFKIYKEAKENRIKETADKYKDLIPYKLYRAMCNYKIKITD